MTASKTITDAPRSSPRSKRPIAASNFTVESPGTNRSTEESGKRERRSQLVNGAKDVIITESSHRRCSPEAVVFKEEPKESGNKQSLHKATQPKSIQIPKLNRKHNVKETAAEQVDEGTPKKAKRKRAAEIEETDLETSEVKLRKLKRKATEVKPDKSVDGELSSKNTQQNKKVIKEEDVEEEEEALKKIKRRRKTKEEKEAEAMPLASRTNGLQMFVGAHVSCAKGQSIVILSKVHLSTLVELTEMKCFRCP